MRSRWALFPSVKDDCCSRGCVSCKSKRAFGPILLVVCRFFVSLLTVRISSVPLYDAGLAIGGYHNMACGSCLPILLNGERQRVVVNLLVRPHIGLWITGDGIVFSVKLTGPLVMRWLTVLVGAIDDNFHLVASGLIHNGSVLSRVRGKL